VEVYDQFGTTYSQGRGALTYDSNTVNVEDQKITLEAGAIVREQSGSAILKGRPNVVMRTDPNTGDVILYMTVLTIEGVGQSYSGTGTYMITSTLFSSQSSEYSIDAATIISIDITTNYDQIWTELFTEMADENSLVSGVDYTISTGTDANGNPNITIQLDAVDMIVLKTVVYRLDIN
jgi:hypothetical protein